MPIEELGYPIYRYYTTTYDGATASKRYLKLRVSDGMAWRVVFLQASNDTANTRSFIWQIVVIDDNGREIGVISTNSANVATAVKWPFILSQSGFTAFIPVVPGLVTLTPQLGINCYISNLANGETCSMQLAAMAFPYASITGVSQTKEVRRALIPVGDFPPGGISWPETF